MCITCLPQNPRVSLLNGGSQGTTLRHQFCLLRELGIKLKSSGPFCHPMELLSRCPHILLRGVCMCGKQRSGSPEKGQQWCDTPPPCILSSWLCLTVERGLGQLRGAAGTQPRQTGHLPVKTWMPSGRCLGSLEGTPLLSCPPCS